jgi:CheY-like chemotaxis protein
MDTVAEATDKPIPTILLAEDSEDDAYFFQRAFRKTATNCSLLRAGNGKLAVDALSKAAAESSLPLLMFLDLKMPVMSGFEVLEWLKSANLPGKFKVIVLSGSNDDADRARAFSLGAAEYLVKPITADVLKAKISGELKQTEPEMGARV